MKQKSELDAREISTRQKLVQKDSEFKAKIPTTEIE